MGRARDIANVLSSSTALATDAEIAAFNYLTQSSASTTYLSQGSASTTYRTINSTGLVKVIPTSISVGSGTGSVDSLGNITFSGASSVSLNGIFSSSYQSYRLTYNLDAGTYSDVFFRLRNAGVDASGSNYYWSALYMLNTTLANNGGSASSTSSTFATVSAGGTSQGSWEINSPFLVRMTSGTRMNTNPSLGEFASFGHTLANSYDGITVTGNLTGTFRVYGYN